MAEACRRRAGPTLQAAGLARMGGGVSPRYRARTGAAGLARMVGGGESPASRPGASPASRRGVKTHADGAAAHEARQASELRRPKLHITASKMRQVEISYF